MAMALNENENQRPHREHRDRPRRTRHAERPHRRQEGDRVQAAANRGVQHLAQRNVTRRERRHQHRLVDVVVLEPEEDVGRLVDRAVHRRCREQGRRHEVGVRDHAAGVLDVADQFPEADADRQQIEQRLEEPGHDNRPGASAGDDPHPLEHPLRAARHDHLRRQDPERQRGEHHQVPNRFENVRVAASQPTRANSAR